MPWVLLALLPVSALAHFQVVLIPETLLEDGGTQTLKMPFSHPADGGPVMPMEKPISLHVWDKEGLKDVTETLQPLRWTSATNTGDAWQAEYNFKALGDHIFVLAPQPYFDKPENKYIQQFTKSIINVGAFPTHWDKELGLNAEIVPMVAPYAILTGSNFSGVVKSNGKPVPNADVEVEFVNYDLDTENNKYSDEQKVSLPSDVFVTQTIKTDSNGVFHYSIPHEGFWGFSALAVGSEKELNGEELSQDAVIWVQARDFK
ncbi:DUF4198 domain-containing protein [Enterovibrio nigricans]|nr:DUF4198 domain-containing protein [Enterovibrio nigricans]